MIKFLTAHTSETDDVEAAVSAILQQLDLRQLQKYSAGIMYYHSDFAETGVTKQICENLPFPVIGSTVSNSNVPGSSSDISLTINVFTSDTTAFTAGICAPVVDEPYMPIEGLYNKMLEEKPDCKCEKPSLFYIIAPNFHNVTGDDYMAALTGLSGGVPIFGSVAFTHTGEFKKGKTFFNGDEYDASMAILAFWGDKEPKFFISDIPDEQIINQKAVITDSYRNRIRKINGIPVMEYLESVGLTKDGSFEEIVSFPLILHMPGGARLIRSIYDKEDKEILCSGVVPSHIPVDISFCDRDFVMKSARKTALECKNWLDAQNSTDSQAALVVSCVARRWTLGSDFHAEMKEIDAGLKDLPYHFVYSRGEFCPVNVQGGKAENYFFNYSLCICII